MCNVSNNYNYQRAAIKTNEIQNIHTQKYVCMYGFSQELCTNTDNEFAELQMLATRTALFVIINNNNNKRRNNFWQS